MKEGTNNENLDIILFTYTQEEFENLCFFAVDPRTHKLWSFVYIMSKQSYAINFLKQILPLYAVKKIKGQTYPVSDSPIHGKHHGESCSSTPQSVTIALVSTCYKSIFLLLLLYRAVTPKLLAYEAKTLPGGTLG